MPLEVPAGNWPASIIATHDLLSSSYDRAAQLLGRSNCEPIRLRMCAEKIRTDVFPIIGPLGEQMNDVAWALETEQTFKQLRARLMAAAKASNTSENLTVETPEYMTEVRSGRRGRPKKVIDRSILERVVSSSSQISQRALADALGIHRHTVMRRMKEENLKKQYSTITNNDLDTIIRHFKRYRPASGLRYAMGYFASVGLRIQRWRIHASLGRVDRLRQHLRLCQTIKRREYHSPRPNAVWHLDGHHKLGRWGIVILGIVDGYSRMVVGLEAHTNNRASTMFSVFQGAINQYGAPSRCRGDRGGENMDVAIWMIKYRGPDRGSFMWGPSTRNTRMERTWGEIGSQFARQWRAFFRKLEFQHQLDVDSPHHIWLLHYLFLDMINNDCERFRGNWNHHPISGKQARNRTPDDMMFLGTLSQGRYRTEFSIHPASSEHYGCNANSGDDNDLDARIAKEQEHNVRHEGVSVATERSPFSSLKGLRIFQRQLRNTVGRIPTGLGVHQSEWGVEGYGDVEDIPFGKRGQKSLSVELPFSVWWPRAVLWAQGLRAMVRVQLALA